MGRRSGREKGGKVKEEGGEVEEGVGSVIFRHLLPSHSFNNTVPPPLTSPTLF